MKQTPLIEILKNAKYSVDYGMLYEDSWVYIIQEKMEDAWTGPLIDDILEVGILNPVEWDEERCEIGNGHHRIAIALLCGFDTIPTVEDGESGWIDSWSKGGSFYDVKHEFCDSLTDDFSLV